MKKTIIMSAISIVLLLLYFIYIVYKNKNMQSIEQALDNNKNVFAYVAIFIGLVGLFLALLSYDYSIKEPKFSINVVNEQGDYSETMGGPLFVEKYKNNDIHYSLSVPTTWKLEVENLGERTANNISVKIVFDNISFEKEFIYNFKTTQHQRGIGGWQGLIFNKGINLLPGESVPLPYFPFDGQAHINNIYTFDTELKNDEIRTFKMKVYIYADDIVCYEKTYNVEIRDPEFEYDEDFLGNKKFAQIVNEINEKISVQEFEYSDVFTIEIPESMSFENVEFAYYYCLRRVNSENSYNIRKFALVFGREYYKRLNVSDSAIEQRILNDIWSEKDFDGM